MAIEKITHYVTPNSGSSPLSMLRTPVSLAAAPAAPTLDRDETRPTGRTVRGPDRCRPLTGVALASMVKSAIREVAAEC